MRKKLNAFFRRSKEHGLKIGQRSKKHAIDSLDSRGVHIKKIIGGSDGKTKMLLPVSGRSTVNGEQNILKNERNRNLVNQIFS
jgi:hypothetical protein